jgi:general secretion pathway protein G
MFNNKRKAFTMVELVFVIVILGILTAIAIPRLAATRDDAEIAKGRSDIAAIRAAIISERQTRLMRGESAYITKLHNGTAGDFTTLFDTNGSSTLLQYGIVTQDNKNGHWDNTVGGTDHAWTYTFRVMNTDNTFTYNDQNGTFKCTSGAHCGDLTN